MWVDVIQNTDEWFNLKLGKPSSSNLDKVMANYGKAFGDPAKKYAEKLAGEILTGEKDPSYDFRNGWMDRGDELEPIAREMYEAETMYSVTNGGIFIEDTDHEIKCADSPDGLVGKDGCIEIKCVSQPTQWATLKRGDYDPKYKWQIQNHIRQGKRKWCDFISYCPEMPGDKKLLIYRVQKDIEKIDMINLRSDLFKNEITSNIKLIAA